MPLKKISTEIIVPLAIALASAFYSLYQGYTHNDKALTERVSKLEAHREDDKGDLIYIREQVDRLVLWAGMRHGVESDR